MILHNREEFLPHTHCVAAKGTRLFRKVEEENRRRERETGHDKECAALETCHFATRTACVRTPQPQTSETSPWQWHIPNRHPASSKFFCDYKKTEGGRAALKEERWIKRAGWMGQLAQTRPRSRLTGIPYRRPHPFRRTTLTEIPSSNDDDGVAPFPSLLSLQSTNLFPNLFQDFSVLCVKW